MDLSAVEVRIIGSLIEKQLTTPQYYPLTLNSLVTACNQTSNRNPVTNYDQQTVEETVLGLKPKGLCRIVHSVHNRATKFRQVLEEVWELEQPELALLGVLMLRGPQTLGELRSRTERMADWDDLGQVETALDRLAERDEPLVVRLPRQPGQKEARYVHLLSGPVDVEAMAAAPSDETGGEAGGSWSPPSASSGGGLGARVEQLEAEVAELRDEVTQLRAWIDAIRTDLGVGDGPSV